MLATAWWCASFGARAAILRVPEDLATPQAAMTIARDGDTIQVNEGEYDGALTLKEGVTVEGSGNGTVFRQEFSARAVARVALRRFRLFGGTNDHHFGIVCEDAEAIVEDVEVAGFHHGISGDRSALTIRRATVTSSFDVAVLFNDSSGEVEACRIVDNPAIGLYVSESSKPVLARQTVVARNVLTGIRVSNAVLRARESRVVDNGIGVYVESGEADFGSRGSSGQNAIFGNKAGDLIARRGVAVEARGNYWGTPAKPGLDRVSASVEYEPYLTRDPEDAQAIRAGGRLAVAWASLRAAR